MKVPRLLGACLLALLLSGCDVGGEEAPPPAELAPVSSVQPPPKIPPAGYALQQLGWLAGSWAANEDGTVTEEHWTVPRGGSMLGMNRVSSKERMLFFEHMRIEARGGGVAYLASPLGKSPTEFALVSTGATAATFSNPKHDFPRSIHYELEGDVLTVTAKGESGGEPKEAVWKWRRVQ